MAAQTSTREGKTALIGEVKENFGKSTSVVFVDYKGLTVDKVTKLRAKFRAAGVEYKVVKNTLVKQAIKDEAWASKLDKTLTGMTGVAYSFEDPSAAAKVLKEFKKDQGDAGQKLVVKAGILDGQFLDGNAVENQLANLPGKNELRQMLLATLQAPSQQFVALLQAPAQNFAYLLKAKEEKQG